MTDKEAAWFNTFNRWAQDHVIQLYHAASFSDDKQPDLFDYEDPRGISKYLKWYYPDLEILGTGAYAIVFTHPLISSKVIRLSVSEADYRGWWEYQNLRYFITHKAMPMIYKTYRSGSLHTAFMERYYPAPGSTIDSPVIQDLILLLRGRGCTCNDLHPSNIMLTREGEPVLTDPES